MSVPKCGREEAGTCQHAKTQYEHSPSSSRARATGITVQVEPPPQRRSTDYADLSSYNSHISSATPSVSSSYQRHMSEAVSSGAPQNGSSGPHQPQSYHNDMPSVDSSQQDTMVRLPSPPPADFPLAPLDHFNKESRSNRRGMLNQESTDSWSAAESLSYRGHVTNRDTASKPASLHGGVHTEGTTTAMNHAGGESSSVLRGRQLADNGSSKSSVLSVHSDRSGAPSHPLPPVHEHQVMDSHSHQRYQQPTETIPTHNLHQTQHSNQPLLARDNSPTPPLPTSLPPPLSLPPRSSHPPQHSRSMDHILEYPDQRRMEPGQGRMDLGSMSQSHAQFQNHNPQTRLGLQNGFSIPFHQNRPRPPSPEYAEPKQVIRNHKRDRQDTPEMQELAQTPVAVPPKSKSKQVTGSKKRQTPAEQLSRFPAMKDVQPKTGAVPKAPPQVKPKHFNRSSSEQPQMLPPSHPHSQAMSLEQDLRQLPIAFHSRQNDLKDVLTQWKLQQEIQEREREREGRREKREATPQNGYPNPVGLLHMPNGMDSSSQPSSRLSTSSQNDRWTTTPSPQQHGEVANHIQNSTTPIVKNAPPVFPVPPQHASNNLHPPQHCHVTTRSHTRKNHELEDIYQRDPRKPRRRKGHVPGAMWKQMPMSSRIESSSDSGSDMSEDNTSLTSEYV